MCVVCYAPLHRPSTMAISRCETCCWAVVCCRLFVSKGTTIQVVTAHFFSCLLLPSSVRTSDIQILWTAETLRLTRNRPYWPTPPVCEKISQRSLGPEPGGEAQVCPASQTSFSRQAAVLAIPGRMRGARRAWDVCELGRLVLIASMCGFQKRLEEEWPEKLNAVHGVLETNHVCL